jgi:hypothetical protein
VIQLEEGTRLSIFATGILRYKGELVMWRALPFLFHLFFGAEDGVFFTRSGQLLYLLYLLYY